MKRKPKKQLDGNHESKRLKNCKPIAKRSNESRSKEDCDEWWANGDEALVEDAQQNDLSFPAKKLFVLSSPAILSSAAHCGFYRDQIKIITWNVAGFRSVLKKGFEEYIREENPDILCLQETKISQEKISFSLPGYTGVFADCKKYPGRHGTGVYTRIAPLSVKIGMGIPKHDDEGRLITVEFPTFYLVNSYVPNSGRELVRLEYRTCEWDRDFLKYLEDLDSRKPVVWCGDFNVAHLWIDLANPKSNYNKSAGFHIRERDNFSRVLERGFADVFREFHPWTKKYYTYWGYMRNNRANNVGWRLDYFVTSRRFLPKVECMWRRAKITGSDHCPLGVMINP